MKKIFCLLLMTSLLAGCSSTSKEEIIKGIVFADTIEDVKKQEDGIILTEIDTLLIYESTYFDKPATIVYYFNKDGQLQEISCQSQTGYEDPAAHFDEFNEIVKGFSEKYGEATNFNDPTPNDPEPLINLSTSYWYEWILTDYEINVIISYIKNEERFMVSVNYFSPELFI